VGDPISYTVRDYLQNELTAIVDPYTYDVVGTFGGGDRGYALAVQPRHEPNALYICFRGVRRLPTEPSAQSDMLGALADNKAMTQSAMASAPWMRAVSKASGIPFDRLRAHRGTCTWHDSIWLSECLGVGLHEWLTEWLASRHCAAPPSLLFVGFSLGGAIAQLTALRTAVEFKALASRIHVLGLGATQWASAGLADAFRTTFGDRAAQLVTAMADEIPEIPQTPPSPAGGNAEGEGGETSATGADSHSEDPRMVWRMSGGGGGACGSHLIDPMTLCTNQKTDALHNVVLCEVSASMPVETAAPTLFHADGSPASVEELHSACLAGSTTTRRSSSHGRDERRSVASVGGTMTRAVSWDSFAALTLVSATASDTASESDDGTVVSTALAKHAAGAAGGGGAQVAWPAPTPMTRTRAASLPAGLDFVEREPRDVRGREEVRRQLSPCGTLSSSIYAAHRPLSANWPHGALKRKRSPFELEAHEQVATRFWRGELGPTEAFAVDCAALHRGAVYRQALLREHWRLKGFAAMQAAHTLPLVMVVNGGWECRADPWALNMPSPELIESLKALPTSEVAAQLAQMVHHATGGKATGTPRPSLTWAAELDEAACTAMISAGARRGVADEDDLAALGF